MTNFVADSKIYSRFSKKNLCFFAICYFFSSTLIIAQACTLSMDVDNIHCNGARGSITVQITTAEIGTFSLSWSNINGASSLPNTNYVVSAGDIDPSTGLFEGDILSISGLSTGYYYLDVISPGGSTCTAQAIVNESNLLTSPGCQGGQIFLATDPGQCTGTIIGSTSWEWNSDCNNFIIRQDYNPYNMNQTGILVYQYGPDLSSTISCTYQVFLYDLEAPKMFCPTNVTGTISDGTCNSVPVFWNASASDNCGIYSITHNCVYPDGSQGPCATGDLYPYGTTTVTTTATDNTLANTNECTFSIVVNEASPSTILLTGSIPDNIYHADQIISNGMVPTSGDVEFRGGIQVGLEPGFMVIPGATFLAEINDCD